MSEVTPEREAAANDWIAAADEMTEEEALAEISVFLGPIWDSLKGAQAGLLPPGERDDLEIKDWADLSDLQKQAFFDHGFDKMLNLTVLCYGISNHTDEQLQEMKEAEDDDGDEDPGD